MERQEVDGLTLDQNHRYWLHGRELLSTTFVLRAAGFVDDHTIHHGNAARGRAVHIIASDVIAAPDASAATVLGDYEPVSEVRGYFDAIKRFQDDYRPNDHTTAMIERSLALPSLQVAGTIDYFGTVQKRGEDKRLMLIDWKTYAYTHWHRLQLCAYRQMVFHEQRDSVMLDWINCMVVQLNNDGTYREWPITFDPSDYTVFRGAVATTLWRLKQGSRGKLYGRS